MSCARRCRDWGPCRASGSCSRRVRLAQHPPRPAPRVAQRRHRPAPQPTVTPSPSASPDACAAGNLATLTPGKLTIGTDNPAYPPWFGGDPPAGSVWQVSDPLSGQGSGATAYAIAAKLGFSGSQVVWVVKGFNEVIQPGPKQFDFDINEISYSADRAQAVDLSDGYFDNSQAVVATKGTPITSAKSVTDLKAFRLGAQVGTTSYAYITDTIQPTTAAKVYNDSNGPIAALKAKQIDGIVVDLGTAFEITGDGEVPQRRDRGLPPHRGHAGAFLGPAQQGQRPDRLRQPRDRRAADRRHARLAAPGLDRDPGGRAGPHAVAPSRRRPPASR